MKKEELNWLEGTSSDSADWSLTNKEAINDLAERKIAEFLLEVQKQARDFKLIGAGRMLTSKSGYKTKTIKRGDLTDIEISMIYYGLFQDRGVRGFVDESNAPNSPYKYKSFYMSKAGIKSILAMIKQGKQQTKTFKKYKKIGLETKVPDKETPEEEQMSHAYAVATNIKKYGLKTKPFFKNAYEKVFGDLNYDLVEAYKKQIITRLKILNNQ